MLWKRVLKSTQRFLDRRITVRGRRRLVNWTNLQRRSVDQSKFLNHLWRDDCGKLIADPLDMDNHV